MRRRYLAPALAALSILLACLVAAQTAPDSAQSYREQAQRKRESADGERKYARQWQDLADKARARLNGASDVMRGILQSQIEQDESEAAQQNAQADADELAAHDLEQKAEQVSKQPGAPRLAPAPVAPAASTSSASTAGGAVDPCLIGTWRASSAVIAGLQRGGAGIVMTIDPDATESVDYSRMQPLVDAQGNRNLWAGTAVARIAADHGTARVESIVRSQLTDLYTGATGESRTYTLRGLGPANLGYDPFNHSYTCDSSSLTFHYLAFAFTFEREGQMLAGGAGAPSAGGAAEGGSSRLAINTEESLQTPYGARTPEEHHTPIAERERTPVETPIATRSPGCCQHYHGFGGAFCEDMSSSENCHFEPLVGSDKWVPGGACGKNGYCKRTSASPPLEPLEEETPTPSPTPCTGCTEETPIRPCTDCTPTPSATLVLREATPTPTRILYEPTPTATETPVVEHPLKCCVITSITITNDFSEPVFYILNGRYAPGMTVPENQLVQPGKSRTYKGDFGECIRIEAIRNVGENGLFDDESICCKDLIGQKLRARKFSYTINSIAWREPGNCPGAPPPPVRPTPTSTRTRTPTPTATPTQTATPTPTPTATQTTNEPRAPTETPTPPIVTPPPEAQDCPQRHDGCAVLIVDLMRDFQMVTAEAKEGAPTPTPHPYKFSDLDEIAHQFHEMDCDVEEAAPHFVEVPALPNLPPGNQNGTDEYWAALAKANQAHEHNQDELQKIVEAETLHRARVNEGAEIAIELVSSHGGNAVRLSPCGTWSVADMPGSEDRKYFHLNNYLAAKRNVCDWFVGDLSCHSGLTPRAIDELDNFGTATCVKAPRIECPEHAGWEADMAMGTSIDATRTCYDSDTRAASRGLRKLLETQLAGGLNSRAKGYAALAQALKKFAESQNSYYLDRGYAKDHPPEHQRKGYQGASVSTEPRPELLGRTPSPTPTP